MPRSLNYTLLLFALAASAFGENDQTVSDITSGAAGKAIVEGVAGRVTTIDRDPIAGVVLQPIAGGPETPPIPEIAISTTADGRYQWPLPVGEYEMRALAPGYQPAAARVVVEAGKVETLDFTLARPE